MKLNINNKQGIELLHFIFERELKPPFTNREVKDRRIEYYNKNNEYVGYMWKGYDTFYVKYTPYMVEIEAKVRQAFGIPYSSAGWWKVTDIHLKSWLEGQLNIKLKNISV